ncbi:hypothetical protein [Rossellomorea aquimaris]|uniref:hypothetical protein n=1 Tax=Rossellomorea aquimaris TaxID=189382 RepID=UPI0005CA3995|nr:hypothetical protein [Rossellomorea aquimaris]
MIKATLKFFIRNFKRVCYKMLYVKNDVAVTVKYGDVDWVLKYVPRHSKDIYWKKLSKAAPQLMKPFVDKINRKGDY